ncbi:MULTISPECIES: IS66-like element accessory protein TnpA [Aminobacter]|uniref:Transposase n=3 Tax=Aminobacter TaxID=31988 RepID=A0ABR6HHM1_AMIAI|nr:MULTISPECIES: transposase [Aminobacter]MBA8910198.1 transposase [Aminobacter ciceronei]MBA9023978.1 transposase [Aminobacter ciceronei]MBB3709931.1 transposase [Aminobacter aminovorans]WMC97410.1 transposase [Aminobacter aminovorans]
MRVEILGQERRRRWCDDKKLEIVMSVGADGAAVTQVAQRHEVTRQQIYAWRHELKEKGILSPATIFLPIEMPAPHEMAAAPEPGERAPAATMPIEVQLNCGRRLRFDSGVDPVVLTRLVRAVETA